MVVKPADLTQAIPALYGECRFLGAIMSKKPFELVRNLNKLTSVLTRLAAAIAEAGGDSEFVFELLDTEDPEVATVMKQAGKLLATLSPSPMALLRAAFAGTYWNENITDENFPGMDANASTKGVRPVNIGKAFTREEAIVALKAMNPSMKPASLDKCIRWCAANPDYQRTHWMLCLAQGWFSPGGVECFVCFDGGTQDRSAFLSVASGRWVASGEVLAEEE